MKAAYYPGCSLEGTARLDYSESTLGVCSSLGIHLEEIPDWNCCGATAAHSIDNKAGIELAGRNLVLASKMPYPDLLVPCPLCFNRLKTTIRELGGERRDRYDVALDKNPPKIWDLANFFGTDNMLEIIAGHVKKPLKDIKAVCYYGCMANRPPETTEEPDCEDPQSMDRIIRALGGTPLPWSFKTDCCGASLALSRPDIMFRLVEKICDMAQRVGANVIVVSCQMCQANLDMYQDRISRETGKRIFIPVLYFTEMIGLACRLPEVPKWLSGHITDAFSMLKETGFIKN